MATWYGPRHKVFISFYGGDEREALDFVAWAESEGIMIPKMLHEAYNGDFVNSSDTEYVMNVIRREYLEDTSVTMVLLGSCTHSRRYVDWELKASLRRGQTYIPNGLLAVALPNAPNTVHLPPRFADNWRHDGSGYAQWYPHTRDASQLGSWIDAAYTARSGRGHLISNRQDMMRNNGKCKHCQLTHPAS